MIEKLENPSPWSMAENSVQFAAAPAAVSDAELEKFRADLDALLAAHQQVWCPAMAQVAPSFVVLEVGPRYVRVVHAEGLDRKNPGSRSAYCFIERSSGNILKAAGWKAPAKHARGNIRLGGPSDWWRDALSPYGAAYLR